MSANGNFGYFIGGRYRLERYGEAERKTAAHDADAGKKGPTA